MTFSKLLTKLNPYDGAAPLVFEADDHVIGAGYHVTELRHSISTGIDCGGNIEKWEEARLQLLDGAGQTHMNVGKFRDIVKGSLSKLPKLSEAPLLVEFSPDNLGLKLMTLDEPVMQEGRVMLRLQNSKAACKPAQRSKSLGGPDSACCGGESSANACCGSDRPQKALKACCA